MMLFPQRSNFAAVREKCIKLICTFVTVLKKLDTFAHVVKLISNKQEPFKIDFGSLRESRRMSLSNARLLLPQAISFKR
jgi:hypothetical protein